MYQVSEGTVEELKQDPMIRIFYDIPENIIDETVRFEIWGSSFNDAGDDFTQIRLFNADDENIHQTECAGY